MPYDLGEIIFLAQRTDVKLKKIIFARFMGFKYVAQMFDLHLSLAIVSECVI